MYVHAKSVESVAALMTLVVTISLVGTTHVKFTSTYAFMKYSPFISAHICIIVLACTGGSLLYMHGRITYKYSCISYSVFASNKYGKIKVAGVSLQTPSGTPPNPVPVGIRGTHPPAPPPQTLKVVYGYANCWCCEVANLPQPLQLLLM